MKKTAPRKIARRSRRALPRTHARAGRRVFKPFLDDSLYGSVPGLADWALQELKAMRNGW